MHQIKTEKRLWDFYRCLKLLLLTPNIVWDKLDLYWSSVQRHQVNHEISLEKSLKFSLLSIELQIWFRVSNPVGSFDANCSEALTSWTDFRTLIRETFFNSRAKAVEKFHIEAHLFDAYALEHKSVFSLWVSEKKLIGSPNSLILIMVKKTRTHHLSSSKPR